MAAFYLDNDVSERLWHLLRIEGHQVFLTKDQHPTRVPDEQQLVTALDLKAHLVTHNYRDFVLLHRAWLLWTSRWRVAEMHPPILVLPQGPELQHRQYINDLFQTGAPAENTLYRYRPSDGWTAAH